MFGSTENIQKISIKLSPTGDISSLLATFHRKWRSITDLPFSYKFLDESVESDYKNDIQLGNFVLIFSVLAILIACLGMIGLVSFSVEQRSKEFSIRRLLGLSDIGISIVIAGELLIPIGISFVCATLLTYSAMNIWLTNFAVKETVGVIPMVVAVAAVLVLSFCVIAVFAFRVSRTNPIENLQKS